MISNIFLPLILATTIAYVICDTRGVYQSQPDIQHQQLTAEEGQDQYYDYVPSNSLAIATPRFGTGFWAPFEFLNLEAVVQPIVTAIGVVLGFLGFFQITNWLFDLVDFSKKAKKTTATDTKKAEKEESNEVDARRKRMLSAVTSERVLSSIEAGEKQFEQ